MYPALTACGQIYKLAEMNTRQIRSLHLQEIVVAIPGGILEEHGSYLPSYTDGYADEAYGEVMVHLFGLKLVFLCCGTEEKFLSREARAEEGLTVHAGVGKHSQILFLRPDLVAPDYRQAQSLTTENFADHVKIARDTGWPGYFGAPGLRVLQWERRNLSAHHRS